MDTNTTAGERLRAWADAQSPPVPMSSLADRLGVSRPHVSNLVANRELPSLALAARIEALTGIPCREWSVTPPAPAGDDEPTAEMPAASGAGR